MSNPSKKQRRPGMIRVRDRTSQDGRWYSPQRDITSLFHRLLRETFYELGSDEWPEALAEVAINLRISAKEIMDAAALYAKIVRCVLARGEDLSTAIEKSGFTHHRVNALVGMVMLDKLTRFFVDCYGSTLQRGQHDPNHQDLQECLKLLEAFEKNEVTTDDASDTRGGPKPAV